MAELLAASTLEPRLQIVAIAGSALLFFFVLELVRRRRLGEPYAILWLAASGVLLVLSVWDDLLRTLSDQLRIEVPANFLFAVGFCFVLVLLLSFSSVISRLSRENKLLAQEVARLNEERGDKAGAAQARAPERQESPIPK
jgi:hypothetical protein